MEPRPLRLLAATVLFINGIVSAQSGHLAEYIRPEASKALMENAYIVHFVECGYSLEQHASFMAENITAYDEFYDFDWLPGYRAIFDTDTLDRVRSDPVSRICHMTFTSHGSDPQPGCQACRT